MSWSDALEAQRSTVGADAFVRKTFRPDELIAAIEAAGRSVPHRARPRTRPLLDSTLTVARSRQPRTPAPRRQEIPWTTPARSACSSSTTTRSSGRACASFFDLQADIEVVGEAADGSEGVAMARRLEPDVVLMDLLMPNMDGITAIGRIKAERPETEIVTMTSFIEEEKVTAALEAGASGYVLKDAEAEEVAAAVRAAFAGEVHLDPAVARLLAQRMRDQASRPRTSSPSR